jgi:hypothetical protein
MLVDSSSTGVSASKKLRSLGAPILGSLLLGEQVIVLFCIFIWNSFFTLVLCLFNWFFGEPR